MAKAKGHFDKLPFFVAFFMIAINYDEPENLQKEIGHFDENCTLSLRVFKHPNA